MIGRRRSVIRFFSRVARDDAGKEGRHERGNKEKRTKETKKKERRGRRRRRTRVVRQVAGGRPPRGRFFLSDRETSRSVSLFLSRGRIRYANASARFSEAGYRIGGDFPASRSSVDNRPVSRGGESIVVTRRGAKGKEAERRRATLCTCGENPPRRRCAGLNGAKIAGVPHHCAVCDLFSLSLSRFPPLRASV